MSEGTLRSLEKYFLEKKWWGEEETSRWRWGWIVLMVEERTKEDAKGKKKKKRERERQDKLGGGGQNLAPTLKLSKLLSDSINSQKKHSFSFSSLLLKKNHEKRRISISKRKKEKNSWSRLRIKDSLSNSKFSNPKSQIFNLEFKIPHSKFHVQNFKLKILKSLVSKISSCKFSKSQISKFQDAKFQSLKFQVSKSQIPSFEFQREKIFFKEPQKSIKVFLLMIFFFFFKSRKNKGKSQWSNKALII